MGFKFQWKQLCCCCSQDARLSTDKAAKNVSNEHKYCGCGESRQPRSKAIRLKTITMKTCESEDDRRTLVEDEAVEALDYEFIADPTSQWTIEDPEIPFNHEFTDKVHPHLDIIIEGTVDEKAYRFAVNLIARHKEGTDIAFHLNPRFDQRYSACNSKFENKWGVEDHSSQQKFPFQRGHPFFLEIFLTHSEFLVSVNGVHYCSFTYRTSILNITALQVEGEVTLSRVHLQYTSFYPSTLPLEYPPCPYKFALPEGVTKYDPQITPIYGYLQGNLKSGSEIEINGQVELLPHAFYVNLQEGCHIWPHPEIPLHMSVRFIHGVDQVRTNSWIHSGWGKEEHAKNCLFTPGYDFTLRITCTEDAFVVQVNDEPQLNFKHRVPYTNIDTLHIQGDVTIYDIRLHL